MNLSFGKSSSRVLEVEEVQERTPLEEASTRFVNSSDDLLSIAGFDGSLKWVNPAHERVLGFPEQEIVGKPYLDFIHADDVERAAGELARLETGQSTNDFEVRVRTSEGSYRWFLFTATPNLEDELIYSIGKDITERKRTEETLRETEGLFLRAFDEAPIGMLTIGLDGRLVSVNRSFAEMIGRTEAELRGVPIWDVMHQADRGPASAALPQLVSGEIRTYQAENRYVHAEGHSI